MEKEARILLVDDDVDFVEATKLILESKPYEVIVAHDGDEGLRKAREENPDLVLLDVIMPGKDGFNIADQFKKDPELSKIPVIMLTSFATHKAGSGIAADKGKELDAEDYLDKPVSPENLLNTVAKYLK